MRTVTSRICSIEINRDFLWDADCEKCFLFIHKPEHIISSTNVPSLRLETHFQEIHNTPLAVLSSLFIVIRAFCNIR